MTPVETGSFTASLPCRYLLRTPPQSRDPLLILSLHGYGSNPEDMLRLTTLAVGEGHVIAAMQGPFQQYLGATPGASSEVGYNWGVRQHHEDAILLHHEIVTTALDRLTTRFGIPHAQAVLVGFSQPVGLNYRFIGTYPDRAGAVIGICGGVPRDWEENKYRPVEAPILHISRDADEFFPVETVNRFPDRLRVHARDVEFHLLPGGHRFPSKARTIIQPWLQRVFAAGTR